MKTNKTYIACVILFGLISLYFTCFGEYSVFENIKLKKQEVQILKNVREMDRKNKDFEREIARLETDLNYIKHLAKHKHDMAEEDEIIFKYYEKDTKKKSLVNLEDNIKKIK